MSQNCQDLLACVLLGKKYYVAYIYYKFVKRVKEEHSRLVCQTTAWPFTPWSIPTEIDSCLKGKLEAL